VRVGYTKARLFHSYCGRGVGAAHLGRDMTWVPGRQGKQGQCRPEDLDGDYDEEASGEESQNKGDDDQAGLVLEWGGGPLGGA
jgi:hypothetical protein